MGTRITPYTAPDQESKKEQVARMFDNIAHSYDFLNHLFSFGIDVLWRKKSIRVLKRHLAKVGTHEGAKIMDMATGTADFAIEAIRMGLTRAHITGVDISPGMLDVGRQKIRKRGWTEKIELMEGDSANLPFETDTFDAYTVAFGVRNFENLEKGLCEILRVLKKGGLFIILETSVPEKFPFKQGYNLYSKNILPLVGSLFSKDKVAYTYLSESASVFPYAEALNNILRKTGFIEVQHKPQTFGVATIYSATK